MDMNFVNNEESLWTEKYRCTTIDDLILPSKIKSVLQQFVDKGEIPNLILAGDCGTGKTSTILALCKQLNMDVMFINASLENGIDILRTKIAEFSASVSLTGNMKCVVLDESDYLSSAAQPGFRAFIEKFSKTTRFVFTCNYSNRIIDPIKSRCTVIDYDFPAEEKQTLLKQMIVRAIEILKHENVKFEPKAVAKLVAKHYPDFRRTINELQTASNSGEINEQTIETIATDDYDGLIRALKEKNFKEMRQWVAVNTDNVADKIFTYFYENAHKFMKPESVPQMVITSAEYQYKAAFAIDQEINVAAYLTELMVNCEFV